MGKSLSELGELRKSAERPHRNAALALKALHAAHLAINQAEDAHNLITFGAKVFDSLFAGAAGTHDVFNKPDRRSGPGLRSIDDASLGESVTLGFLADQKAFEFPIFLGSRPDGTGDKGVSPDTHSGDHDGLGILLFEEIREHLTDDSQRRAVQGDSLAIDVDVGLLATGKFDADASLESPTFKKFDDRVVCHSPYINQLATAS
jgi:hypothetical protein